MLNGAQEIGGVTVKIGADLAGLKAGVAEAKQLTSQMGVVKLVADTSQLFAQVRQLSLSIPPVKVPVIFDVKPPPWVGYGGPVPGGSQRPPFFMPPSAPSPAPVLPPPSAPSPAPVLPPPWVGYGGGVPNGPRPLIIPPSAPAVGAAPPWLGYSGAVPGGSQRPFWMGMSGGYNGMGYEGGVGPVLGPANAPWRTGLRGWINSGGGMKALGPAIKTVSVGLAGVSTLDAGYNLVRAAMEQDLERREEFIQAGRGAIQSIPLGVGSVIDKVGYAGYATISGLMNFLLPRSWGGASGFQLKTDYGIAADTAAASAKQDAIVGPRIAAGKARLNREEATRAMAGQLYAGNVGGPRGELIAARQAAAEYFEKNIAGGNATPNSRAVYAQLQHAANVAGANARADYVGGQAGLAAAQRGEFLAMGERNYAFGQARAGMAAGSMSESVAALAQSQRLAKDFYKADLTEFDHVTQQKLDSAKDAAHDLARAMTLPGMEVNKAFEDMLTQEFQGGIASSRAAGRRVKIAEQEQQMAQSAFGYAATARSANLRAGGQFAAATLQEHDDLTDALAVNLQLHELRGFYAARDAIRASIVAQQTRDRTQLRIGLESSARSAEAIANNQPTLAGIEGLIGGLRGRYEATDIADRGMVAEKQARIVSATIRGLNRPTGYAEEGDGLNEAPGGPGGTTGEDIVKAIEALTEYLKQVWPVV